MPELLTVRNVDVYYGSAQAVSDVSVALSKGDMAFLVGRNGAGKTTLLKTIAGFLKPTHGAIIYKGQNVVGIPPEKMSLGGVRYVFQDKRVFSKLTVRENIELAAYAAKEPMDKALDKVLSIYPKLERFLDTKARGLSGGQRQLLLIGRALVGNPELLLIDEPTEGLAAGVINDIFQVLTTMKGQITMLIVEQNLSVVCKLADRVLIMQEGRIPSEVDQAEIRDQSRLEAWL